MKSLFLVVETIVSDGENPIPWWNPRSPSKDDLDEGILRSEGFQATQNRTFRSPFPGLRREKRWVHLQGGAPPVINGLCNPINECDISWYITNKNQFVTLDL